MSAGAARNKARTTARKCTLRADLFVGGTPVRTEIRRVAREVSGAYNSATRLLELYCQSVLTRMSPVDAMTLFARLDWQTLVRQCIVACTTTFERSTVHVHIPGIRSTALRWRALPGFQARNTGTSNKVISYEAKAYANTLLKNYCNPYLALRRHCQRVIRWELSSRTPETKECF